MLGKTYFFLPSFILSMCILQLEKNLEMSNHTLHYGLQARTFDPTDFKDTSIKRILKKLSDIERAALPEDELKEVRMKEKPLL